METVYNFIKTDICLLSLFISNILLLILFIFNSIYLKKIKNNYSKFLIKLGKGNNIEDALKKYIEKVEIVNEQNKEIKNFCNELDKNINECIKKVGIVRYNAFKDTGSNLSFALALLDENNNGVVLNGIYSREMSNIYAKPVQNGTSTYTMSQEEIFAINKAIENKN